MLAELSGAGVVIMMLNNVGFMGFSIKSVSYKVNDVTERGSFNVFFSDSEIKSVKGEDAHDNQIVMAFDVDMIGYAEGVDPEDEDSEPAFEAEFIIETRFIDLNENPMNEEDIEEHMWFFENFNQISTKIAADNTFKNSELSHIPIPWTAKALVSAE